MGILRLMETTLSPEERAALEDVRYGYGDRSLAVRRNSTEDDEPKEPQAA